LSYALSEKPCIRKAVNERAFDSSPFGLADAPAEDEAAMGTEFAFMANEPMGKGAFWEECRATAKQDSLRMRPARSPGRPVDPATPLLT
jgi:hypothetical protein